MGFLSLLPTSSTTSEIPVSYPMSVPLAPILRPQPKLYRSKHPFVSLALASVIDAKLAEVLQEISSLTLSAGCYSNLGFRDEYELRDRWLTLENFLTLWQSRHQSREMDGAKQVNINNFVCLAALMFCNLNLRKQGDGVHSSLSDQLQAGLTQYRGRFHSDHLRLMLWILFIGGASTNGSSRTWYISQIQSTAGYIGKSWNGIREILQSFLWTDTICEELCRNLWAESFSI